MAFTRPSNRYVSELQQVADAADDLFGFLADQPNMLPIGFPSDAVITLCSALIQIPDGSVEGSVPILEAGREQCPTIRRNYIPAKRDADDPDFDPDAPPVYRGGVLDALINDLYVAIGTAIDAFKDEYGAGFKDGIEVDPPVKALPEFDLESAIKNSRSAELVIEAYLSQNSDVLESEETLRRGLVDTDIELKVARSAASMPEPKPSLLSRLGEYIAKAPEALRIVGLSTRAVADIAAPIVNSAAKISVSAWQTMLDAISVAGEGIEESGRRMAAWRDKKWRQDAEVPNDENLADSTTNDQVFNAAHAMKMILAGHDLPESWYPQVMEINLGYKGFKNWNDKRASKGIISRCVNTKSVDLSGSQIDDFDFLSDLTDLKEIRLTSTRIFDLDWAKKINGLRNLHLNDTPNLSNICGVRNLRNLMSLQIKNAHNIIDLSPILQLERLEILLILPEQIDDGFGKELAQRFPNLSITDKSRKRRRRRRRPIKDN